MQLFSKRNKIFVIVMFVTLENQSERQLSFARSMKKFQLCTEMVQELLL